MSILKEDVIIEVLSEAHEKAIRERAKDLGYKSPTCNHAWESYGKKGEKACLYLIKDYRVEFSSKRFYDREYSSVKRVTLDYLYMEHEDKKTKEIKERIKKCEEELAKLRGEL